MSSTSWMGVAVGSSCNQQHQQAALDQVAIVGECSQAQHSAACIEHMSCNSRRVHMYAKGLLPSVRLSVCVCAFQSSTYFAVHYQ